MIHVVKETTLEINEEVEILNREIETTKKILIGNFRTEKYSI